MTPENERDLRKRTKMFALRIIRLYSSLAKTTAAQVIGKQVLRSGTSVGAQYRYLRRLGQNSKIQETLTLVHHSSFRFQH
jgi:four helix bundle protein